MSNLKALASDNFSGVHPEVMSALQQANSGHAMAYGSDPWTQRFEEAMKEHFGSSAEAFLVGNGTAANVLSLKHVLAPWQAVICTENAHLLTDECGSIQAIAGCSLLPVAGKNGKLTVDRLKHFLDFRGNQHHVQPAAISVTQSTELGTVYTLEELQKIGQFAQEQGLLLHMDGARLSNAAAALNVSLKELTAYVDILSFGGTKNGLMGAEAAVFLKPGLAQNFKFLRKQSLHLYSKMRFLAAQFVALLEGDLWLRNARHSNEMAKLLEGKLRKEFPQLKILYPVEANALFVHLPPLIYQRLQKKYFFWIWNEEHAIVRWMTTWDTQPELIDAFVSDLKKELQ